MLTTEPNKLQQYQDYQLDTKDRLEALSNYTILELGRAMPGCRSNEIVKVDERWKSDFIADWVWSGVPTDYGERCKEKWKRIKELAWPIFLWHGTSPDNQKLMRESGRHYIYLHETLSTGTYADARAMMGYAIPAPDLTVSEENPQHDCHKTGVDTDSGLPYIGVGEFKDLGKKPYLKLEHKFTYPFSDELIQYLQAMGISYEIKHNEKRVEVPLFQRYISGDGIFTSNGEEYIGEKPRPWDSDLLGPDEVIFKDETKIKIPPKPIPVPMGN